MAGLIRALFGGRSRPPDPDPLPGQGGYTLPRGPYGEGGFPGSTSPTRTFNTRTPRVAKIDADTNSGINNALGTAGDLRQASYRGDVPGAAAAGPRATSLTVTPQPLNVQQLQENDPPAEFYGGYPLKSRPGYADNVGLNPPHVRDTEFPRTVEGRYLDIAAGVPGGLRQRNTRYYAGTQARPGEPAAAGMGKSPGGPDRYVYDGINGGFQSYQFTREMPYGGRGDGARGAALSGLRYYANADQFTSQEGAYGQARMAGPNHRPTTWTEPAPWTSGYYDTTASTGTPDSPGTDGQQLQAAYVSPDPGRVTGWRRGG